MDGTALIVCDDLFATDNAKTAHGLVRGTERYRVLGVVDGPTAGRDAGEVLDGKRRGIPVFATIRNAVGSLGAPPDFCVVGVATSGGRLTPGLRALMVEAIDSGMSVVNGLHEFLSEDAEVSASAARRGVTIRDVRKPAPRRELHFWSGEVLSVGAPRLAVLGTDCALGKRTTARFLRDVCREAGIRAELILLEGQSALRNPSGPCGSELLLSGGAKGVILQHAPARACFEGLAALDLEIPSVADEIALIAMYGARTLAVALNSEHLSPEELSAHQRRLAAELGIPVVRPLEEGVEALVPVVREFIRAETRA